MPRQTLAVSFVVLHCLHMGTRPPYDLVLIKRPDYNSPIIDEPVAQGFYFLYGVPFFVVMAYIIFAFTYHMKMEEVLKKQAEIKPQHPKCGRIDENNFEFCGPLRLQSKFQGNVKHALGDEPSNPIEELVYDENLNEVVDIGSNVEEIEGMSELSTSAQRMFKTTSMLYAKSAKNSRLMSKKARALKASLRGNAPMNV
ncbi:hypothetical protein Aduo_014782 [Ancylostoma duodenale]